ncbi:MAG: tetratricopeptide repeat protein [Phycisphaeraceae bacterium]
MQKITIATLFALAAGLAACEAQPTTQTWRVPDEDQAQAEQFVQEAEAYLERGLSDSAMAAFSEALEENPRLLEAHLGMGHIFRGWGEYDLAGRAYERAVETDPGSYEANYYLGLARQLVGRVDDAVRHYLRALAINPDGYKASRDLASAYLQQGRARQAIPYAEQAVEQNPEDQAAWANLAAAYSVAEQWEKAVDAYRQALDLGESAPQLLLGLADAHINLENYQRAEAVLNSLLRQRPNVTAYERLGYIRFKQGRFDAALEAYRSALEQDSDDPASLNGLGVSLMTQYLQGGRENDALRREAVDAWRRSLKIRPNQPQIVDLLARFSRG